MLTVHQPSRRREGKQRTRVSEINNVKYFSQLMSFIRALQPCVLTFAHAEKFTFSESATKANKRYFILNPLYNFQEKFIFNDSDNVIV